MIDTWMIHMWVEDRLMIWMWAVDVVIGGVLILLPVQAKVIGGA